LANDRPQTHAFGPQPEQSHAAAMKLPCALRSLACALGGMLASSCALVHDRPSGPDASSHDATSEDAASTRDVGRVDDAHLAPDAATLDSAALPDAAAFDVGTDDAPPALDAAPSDGWSRGDAGVHDPIQGPLACGAPAAVAYHIDPAHRAYQPDDTLRLPLTERWRAALDGRVSYPLVACGRVYVTVSARPGEPLRSSVVVALDSETGAIVWGPTPLDVAPDYGAQAAYDDGHLFVVTAAGAAYSLDAATGTREWRVQLEDEYSFTVPPIASAGLLIVAGSGANARLYAVEQATGSVRWTQGLEHLPGIATDGASVFLASCAAGAFDAASGAMLWQDFRCAGVPQEPAVHAGQLYVRAPMGMSQIYDATSGAHLGTFTTLLAPAFSGDTGYFADRRRLRALRDGSETDTWTYAPGAQFRWAPIVVGDQVVVGNETDLSVLSRADGAVLDTHPFATPLGPRTGTTEGVTLLPWQDMAEAGGILLIPVAGGLVAF
jgi:outer membrane protein assembly factor BamB